MKYARDPKEKPESNETPHGALSKHPLSRRETLRALAGFSFITVTGTLAAADPAELPPPPKTNVCGEKYLELGHYSDVNCKPGRYDNDCGLKSLKVIGNGYSDESCGSVVSRAGKISHWDDRDCGIFSGLAGLLTGVLGGHQDQDCGTTDLTSGKPKSDADCGISTAAELPFKTYNDNEGGACTASGGAADTTNDWFQAGNPPYDPVL